jgi:folate-dependent phosphoribosylglycinamide formyltransferase PurN
MSLTPLFDPGEKKRPMNVAGFMSGSGTNIRKLLDLQRKLEEAEGESPFRLVFIFSDRSDGGSRGEAIALDAGVPYFSYDVRRFHQLRGLRRSVLTSEGMQARREYDAVARKLVEAFDVDVIALGGYMSFITLPRCVNVHPADLTLTNSDGARRFVGDEAVRDALTAGATELRASTLWTDLGVDSGPLLLISKPLEISLPTDLHTLRSDPELLQRTADEHQDRLKERGDWEIFPLTIQWIAQGRFAMDENGVIHLDGEAAPNGLRL